MTEWMMETGLAVAALLLLVLLTRRAVARQFGPRAAYSLWILPILRLIWPATAIPASWLPERFRPEPQQPIEFIAQTPVPYEFLPAAPIPEASPDISDMLLSALPFLWIIGALGGALWFTLRHVRYAAHLKVTTVPLDPSLQVEADRAARLAGLKTRPNIAVSLVDDGPSVTGLFRPVIVLPSAFSERFTSEQRRLALIHEMSHIKRGDLWTATAMLGFRLLNWPNPLIHLAWPAFRADQEAACDATVLSRVGETERASYAETLLTAATHSGRASPATGAGLSLSLHHPVKERLMTLGTNSKRHTLARAGLATLLLTGAALTAPLSLADDPEKVEVEKEIKIIVDNFETRDLSELDGFSESRTFVFTNKDGSGGTMTREEFMEQYGDKLPEGFGETLAGEPGLQALRNGKGKSSFVSVSRFNGSEGSFELRKENGETRAFRIEDDGTRTEIDPSEIDGLKGLEGLDGLAALDMDTTTWTGRFPQIHLKTEDFLGGETDGVEKRVRIFGLNGGEFPERFTFDTSGASSVQLQSAETMIESTARRIEKLRETDEGRSDRDLREAERELKKAQKALEKAQEAIKRRGSE